MAHDCVQGRPVTRPDELSTPCRALYARSESAWRDAEQRYGLSRRTIDSIALIVIGQGMSFTDSSLVAAIAQQAELAQRLLSENRALKVRVQYLEDPAVRDLALNTLERAEQAINEGRFSDAESEFAYLKQLRWTETEQGQQAWESAVTAQSQAAEVAGDYERARAIFLEAADAEQYRVQQAFERSIWRRIDAAEVSARRGENFGIRTALDQAIGDYRNTILPRLSEQDHPQLWADAQTNLGHVLQTQGERTAGLEGLDLLARSVGADRHSTRHIAAGWAIVLALGSIAPTAASAQEQAQLAPSPEAQPALADTLADTFADALTSDTPDALSDRPPRAIAEAPPPRIVVGPEGVAGGAMRYPVRSEVAGSALAVSFSATRPVAAVAAGEGGALPTHAPVEGRITSTFGTRLHPVLGTLRRHAGVDLAAPAGSPVRATSDGIVSAAGWAGGYGLRVALDHGGEVETRYAHLASLAVSPGQQVRRGDVIGFVGSTGLSTGPHVHYELRRGGRAIDPLAR